MDNLSFKENRINSFVCSFEDWEIEKEFRQSEWSKYSKYIPIIMALTACAPLALLVSGIISEDASSLMLSHLHNSFYVSILGFLAFANDSIRKKYLPWMLLLVFALVFPVNLIFNFQYSSHKVSIIPLYPIMTSLFILRLAPINFVMALSASLPAFIAGLYIQDNSSIRVTTYILFVVLYLIMVFDKWRSEINNRNEYSKSRIISKTKKLMYETLKNYFGEFLSDKILSERGNLKGEIRWVTISFTDISKYSTIIENMSPEVAVKILNEYFTTMHNVIEKYGGHILNYIGDAIMVVFGAPDSLEDHEIKAVQCAVEMRDELKKLNSIWDNNESSRYWKNHNIDSVTHRTGIHTGSIIAGNIGSDRMLQYSAIGDVVNVAARLEQANKEFNTSISLSEEIYINLTKSLHEKVELSGEIKLKGRSIASKVYYI